MENIDESLYSRQLYVLGKEAMIKMANSSVFITGMNGLGIEISKCLILGGIKNITLHDTENINYNDLSTSYYFTENDINKNKAEIAYSKLYELNTYVKVEYSKENLQDNLEILKNYKTVVIIDYDIKDQNLINNFCHKNNINFIAGSTQSLCGYIFCDFGEDFEINDTDGEEIKKGVISKIENNIFVTADDHGLSSDDIIKLVSLDQKENLTCTYQINRIKGSNSFEIKGDNYPNKYLQYNFEQVKIPRTINFKSFESFLNKIPEEILSFDPYNFERNIMTYCLFMNSSFEDYKLYIKKQIENGVYISDKFYDEFIKQVEKFYKTKDGKFCPLDSVIGGIIAQEVMKSVSGKFTPINQFFVCDFLDLIPDNINQNQNITRYNSQEMIFGQDVQNKLLNSNIFIVGSGAIGCEHLKNLAMIGIGNITITDMDTIEKSNLNRQFLFRNHHIGKFKSEVASEEILKFNPNIKISYQKNKVGPETEHIYDNKFFNSLTCVLNALDNVQARLYMDNLCIRYCTPLLESGTLGSKGNTQSIIPHLTESYGSQQDQTEKSIPICTIKNFPYMIEHTIQYARDYFEGIFTQLPQKIMSFNDKKNKYLDTLTINEVLEFSKELKNIMDNNIKTFEDCIKYGYTSWYELFNFQIKNLIEQYPEDYLTEEKAKFWSGTKRFPKFRNFDETNDLDILFVKSCAILKAKNFGINYKDYDDIFIKNEIKKIIQNKEHEKIQIESNTIARTEEEEKKLKQEQISKVQREDLYEEINNIFSNYKIENIIFEEFEKDDDTNYHINYIHSFANLRGENYHITQVDKYSTKKIAGKIIPAIATTTAIVSGLVCLELMKVIQQKQKLEDYKNYYVNLAVPIFTSSEPGGIKKHKISKFNDDEFSLWDSFEFNNPKLVDIIEYFEDKYKLSITSITAYGIMLLSSFMDINKRRERMGMLIKDIYEDITKTELKTNMIELCLIGDNMEDEDSDESDNESEDDINDLDDEFIDIPSCKIYF